MRLCMSKWTVGMAIMMAVGFAAAASASEQAQTAPVHPVMPGQAISLLDNASDLSVLHSPVRATLETDPTYSFDGVDRQHNDSTFIGLPWLKRPSSRMDQDVVVLRHLPRYEHLESALVVAKVKERSAPTMRWTKNRIMDDEDTSIIGAIRLRF